MATMVISVPDSFKPLMAGFVGAVQEVVNTLTRTASAFGDVRKVDYARVEREVSQAVAQVERASHEVLLSGLDVDVPRLIIEGIEHARVLRAAASYRTLAGEVEVERSLYRPVGQRNAPTLDPIVARTGALKGRWLPATAKAMAHGVQMTTSRDAHQHARQLGRLPYSRSAFEDVAHEVGRAHVAQPEVLDELVERMKLPDEATSVSIGLDRVSLPMEEPLAPPSAAAETSERKVERNYRMAYVGTVALHDEQGNAIHTLRYGCMPAADPGSLVQGMVFDVLELVRRRAELNVVKLADGAAELWNLLDGLLDEQLASGHRAHSLVDFWHLAEKLAAAARVIAPRTHQALLAHWKAKLLDKPRGARSVLRQLRKSGKEWVAIGDDHPVHEAITYIDNHAHRMRYQRARALGLPIGSGVTEATCKSLVQLRMKRPGARWKHDSGDRILKLRALALSDRWDEAIDLTLRARRRKLSMPVAA